MSKVPHIGNNAELFFFRGQLFKFRQSIVSGGIIKYQILEIVFIAQSIKLFFNPIIKRFDVFLFVKSAGHYENERFHIISPF